MNKVNGQLRISMYNYYCHYYDGDIDNDNFEEGTENPMNTYICTLLTIHFPTQMRYPLRFK
jgi:hypothetical protein